MEGGAMSAIVLAIDGSPSAEKAAATAIDLAKATGWPLHVVTAWHVPVYEWGYAPVGYVPDLANALREHAETVTAAAVQLATESGVEATAEVRQGEAAGEICAAALERGAELVVVGSHGWGALRRLVFGSVSTAVMHEAACPVLVVRGITKDEEPELAVAGRDGVSDAR
jgi:nucleotide-binding universal stress UspA family protein